MFIKILADSIPKQIDDVKILYDVTQSGKIEDVRKNCISIIWI